MMNIKKINKIVFIGFVTICFSSRNIYAMKALGTPHTVLNCGGFYSDPIHGFIGAAGFGEFQKVKSYIEKNPDLIDRGGACALNVASHFGHLEVVRFLLDNGISPNANAHFDLLGEVSALESAVYGHDDDKVDSDRRPVVIELLKRGATIIPRIQALAELPDKDGVLTVFVFGSD